MDRSLISIISKTYEGQRDEALPIPNSAVVTGDRDAGENMY